jgi:DNA-binding NarL/FixJ family response regulator
VSDRSRSKRTGRRGGSIEKSPPVLAVAICCANPALCHGLEHVLRQASGIAVAGLLDKSADLIALIQKVKVDAVLVDSLACEQLADDDRIAGDEPPFVLIGQAIEEPGPDMVEGRVRAILPDTAAGDEIVAAIKAVASGYVVLPKKLLAMLIKGQSGSEELPKRNAAEPASLSAREIEVLAAMADGVSNKVIARRLRISFHTAKFHVAAILAKLDADTRTEAVAKAAQLGLVML